MKAINGSEFKYLDALKLTAGELVTGSSQDYIYGKVGIPYVVTLEIRDKGEHGFELPTSQIQNTGKEVYAFCKILALEILDNEKQSGTENHVKGEDNLQYLDKSSLDDLKKHMKKHMPLSKFEKYEDNLVHRD